MSSFRQSPAGVPLLDVRELSKSFASVRALRRFSLAVFPGEVHGLVGANGSGKSTFVKCLAGYHEPDAGTLKLRGQELIAPYTAAYAQAHGMHFMHQDAPLLDNLSVLENLGILGGGYVRGWGGRINWRRQRAAAREMLSGFLHAPPLDALAGALSPPERTAVAIAALLQGGDEGAQLFVLDEPTSTLSLPEAQRVMQVVKDVTVQRAGVVFISHRLEEVLSIADRISVLRDGELVATVDAAGVDAADLLGLMLGRAVLRDRRVSRTDGHQADRTPRLRVTGLSGVRVQDVSFEVGDGEVVGVTGVVGCGRSELGRLLGGIQPWTRGSVEVDGGRVRRLTITSAEKRGIMYVPPDRRSQSLIPRMTVRENVLLRPRHERSLKWTTAGRERLVILPRIQKFGVVPADPEMQVMNLSGGNQQKVVLAKWLEPDPRILILDEPTRGVDVGAKAEIHELLRAAAARGATIFLLATEAEEVAAVCDRALVLRDGRLVAELDSDSLQEETIVHSAYV